MLVIVNTHLHQNRCSEIAVLWSLFEKHLFLKFVVKFLTKRKLKQDKMCSLSLVQPTVLMLSNIT